MRTETKYYAFDDTEFESEDECLAYEKTLRGFLCGARFFDAEGREITFDPDCLVVLNDAMYCHIVDDKAAPTLFNWLRDYADLPDGELKNNDLWWFDPYYLEWVNVTEELKMLTGVVKKIEEAERKGAD